MKTIMVYFDRKSNAIYKNDTENKTKITSEEAFELANELYMLGFAETVKFTPLLVNGCVGWVAEVRE